MTNFIQKTFGGLSLAYYARQFFFGLLLLSPMIWFYYFSNHIEMPIKERIVWGIGMTLLMILYPYSRFVYESIISFIMGNNVFFINIIIIYVSKLITMYACLFFAPFIAPAGLIYLYFHHTKMEKQQSVINHDSD